MEGMQGMIYVLQQQLKEAKDQITQLQEENALIKSGVPHTEYTSSSVVDQKSNVTEYRIDRTSPRPVNRSPIAEDKCDRTPADTSWIKTERTSPSPRDVGDKFDRKTELPSEEESMDTDNFYMESKKHTAQVNHIHHHHSPSAKAHSQVDVDRTRHYDSMDDSQEGWSTPTRRDDDDFNGQKRTQSGDSTPEMDSLRDRNFTLVSEGLQNGVTRTTVKTEEMGEA